MRANLFRPVILGLMNCHPPPPFVQLSAAVAHPPPSTSALTARGGEGGSVRAGAAREGIATTKEERGVGEVGREESERRIQRTFYRRKLPDSCVALSSREGRELFSSAMSHDGLKSFFPLMEQFSTQSEPAFCGISTLVIILNALSVDPRQIWKGVWRWYDESMLNCCVDLEEIKKTGITFNTFACLAKCQGLTVGARLGSDATIDEFRDAVKTACVGQPSDYDETQQQAFLVVSYSRKTVGQTGDGHFSPVAAYDEVSDSVLILDAARYKYGPHWVSLRLLYEALQPLDPVTQKSRGYVLLSHEDDEQSSHMPQSILFRTKKVQNSVRKQYKDYLGSCNKESPITMEEVINFWTKDGNDDQFIWSMMEAQLIPVDEEQMKATDSLRILIQNLLGRDVEAKNDNLLLPKPVCVGGGCSFNSQRQIPVSSAEAIFVTYLASLSPEHRREVVFFECEKVVSVSEAESAREQLLAEAELIQYAIEVSDMTD